MPYSTVVAGTTITSSWANTNVRDQVVTPFTDATARTAAISTPVEGMVSYLTGVNRFDFYNGAAWQPVAGVAAKVVRSSDQSIPASALTAMEWQTVSYDGFNMWSAGTPTRLTAPWAGYYAASGSIAWASHNSGDYRRLSLYVNGSVEDAVSEQLDPGSLPTDPNPCRQNVAGIGIKLAAAGFVELRVTHDAAAARTVDAALTNFKLAYLGPAV